MYTAVPRSHGGRVWGGPGQGCTGANVRAGCTVSDGLVLGAWVVCVSTEGILGYMHAH